MTKIEEIRAAILLELRFTEDKDTPMNHLSHLLRLRRRWTNGSGPITARKREYFITLDQEIKKFEREVEQSHKMK